MISALSTKRAFLFVLFVGLFAMTARNVTDPDIWWHLKTGEYISIHKLIPRTDPFSYTRAGAPWVTHEWLTELGLYEVQRVAGFGGLIVIFSAILVAAFVLLYLRSGPASYIAGIATLCGAWATAPVWGVRPQVLSLLLASLWLFILERADARPHLLWWTLPLTLLWVNLHAGFALGLVLSVLFLVSIGIDRATGEPASTCGWRMPAFILSLDLLLVPLNPSGLRLFSYPIETLRSAAMHNFIAEWASPNFHRPEYWPFLFLILATFLILSWSREAMRPRDLLLLLVGLYAGLVSIRMIPLFVLVAVPIVSRRIGIWPKPVHRLQHQLLGRSLLNLALVVVIAGFALIRTVQVIQRQPAAEAEQFPARAVAFLKTHPSSGRIFNHYDWGGYLIWKLFPQVKVFVDGRADLYSSEAQGSHLLDEFAKVFQLRSGWSQVLQQWHIETVIVPPDSPLAAGLQANPAWAIVYKDPQAIIFRTHP